MKQIMIMMALASSVFASEKPNVLLIISDDQGYSDFGFMGHPILRTPRIDQLAQSGAVFRNFVTGPACSPGRSMIYTGRNNLLTGVWGVPPRQNLRRDETLMPAFFGAAGYESFYTGKLDSVAQHHMLPWVAGWDHASCVGPYQHHNPLLAVQPEGERPIAFKWENVEGWTAEYHTEEAVRFIQDKKDQPWLLTMAYIIPHTRWTPVDERTAPYYREKGCSESLAASYSHIEQMDTCVGRLLDTLKETGQEKRTIVVYLSDNGQTAPDMIKLLQSEGPSALKEGLIKNEDFSKRNVAKLRGNKSTVWENGIRVPLIVSFPGTIPPGDRAQFGSAEDVLPTVLDYAGIDDAIVPHKPFSGVSLRPALDQKNVVFDHPEIFSMTVWGDGMVTAPKGFVPDPSALKFEDHHMALRGATYKLHARPGGKVELYDIVGDTGETTDVSKQFPEITQRMLAECRRRWDYAITDGKAFRMGKLVIGDPGTMKRVINAGFRLDPDVTYPDGTYWCSATKMQDSCGTVRIDGATYTAWGFSKVDDRAEYSLECKKAGRYAIQFAGKDLSNAGHLVVRVAGQNLKAKKTTAKTVEFGVVDLPLGNMKFEIVAGEPQGNVSPLFIEHLLFVWQSLPSKPTEPIAAAPAGNNRVINGDFSVGLASWSIYSQEAQLGAQRSATPL